MKEGQAVLNLNYPRLRNHKLTRKSHGFMDSLIDVANIAKKAFETENAYDLFGELMNLANLTYNVVVDPEYATPFINEDTKLVLAQAIVTDQCLILTQEANQLHIMVLHLQKGILDTSKNTLTEDQISKKTLKPILQKKNRELMRINRRIAVHPKNYHRKTIGSARTIDKDNDFFLSLYVPTSPMGAKFNDELAKNDHDFKLLDKLEQHSDKMEENSEAIEDIVDDKETIGMDQVYVIYFYIPIGHWEH